MAAAEKSHSPKLSRRYCGYVGDYCCVPGCNNSRGKCCREGKTVSFYKFPADKKRRQQWLDRIRRGKVNDIGRVVAFQPKTHSRVCSEHFVGGTKVDEPTHTAYIPTSFPRNTTKQRKTRASSLAGTFTPSPQTVTKKKCQDTGDSVKGRPVLPKKLNYYMEGSDKAVWNSDHDYVKPQTQCEPEEVIESLKQENADMKSKQLRLENIKDNPEKIQFWTNLPNYEVFQALCCYLKTRVYGGTLIYWKENLLEMVPLQPRGDLEEN